MSLMIRCHKENKNVELQPPAFGASIPFNQRRVSPLLAQAHPSASMELAFRFVSD